MRIGMLVRPSLGIALVGLRAAFGGRFEIGQTGGAFSRAEISALNENSFDEDATHISVSVLFGWNFGN